MTNTEKSHSTMKGRLAGLEYFSLRDYRNLLWRRKVMIATTTLTIALGVSLFAYRIPNQYQARTTIMVDPGKVPESYVKSTATIDANQRLSILQERILSDTRLGQVADELRLYRNLKAKTTQNEVMDMMRKKIAVDATISPPPAKTLKAFNVSFTAANPVIAAKVSNRLASLFIEENLKVREQQVVGTADFFDGQLQKAKEEVDEKSQKLAQLKARYASELPEAQNLHLQALTSAQLAMREEEDALSRTEQQKVYLQSLLASSPDVINLDSGGSTANTGLEEQLEKLQADMDQLRSHYGPSYPDVLSKAADIQALQQKIKQLGEQGKSDATTSKKHSNPAIESQIAQADEQIRKHEMRQAELASQIKFHVAAIGGVPAVQEQVSAATNDVAVASDRYKHLEDRKFGADMFSDVEARQQGERFVLLDPAQPPDQPITPNRAIIDSIGVVAGLVVSLLFVAVLELLDPSVKTEREIREQLKAPIFGEIPPLNTESANRRRRLRLVLATAGNLLLVVGNVGVLVASFRK
jgi:polysaccharide chain length determinant protein (PEP-CTERM system associated)